MADPADHRPAAGPPDRPPPHLGAPIRFRHRLADRLILQPSRQPIDPVMQVRRAVPWSRGRLECFVARKRPGAVTADAAWDPDRAEPPELLVLKLPGRGGRAERSTLFPANLLPEIDAEVWTWNPPGYGGSEGRASLSSLPRAAEAVHRYLDRQRRGGHTRLWLVGNSLGSVTALHLAAQGPVEGLMLRNPPPLVEMVARHDRWWNLWGGGRWLARALPPELNPLQTAPRVAAAAIFVQSDADSLVPPPLQETIRRAFGGPQRLVRLSHAEHDTPPREADLPALERACRWLWETGPVA